MSDDTTTWLKKNPSVNPLRKSLKTSLRFHVPNSDMNTSIMSNPDNVKDQGLFIPRMMQKTNMQMRKSRAYEFKVPEMVVNKSVGKKESSGSVKKKVPTPVKPRKSFLPVPKSKAQVPEKINPKINPTRPSYIISNRRTTAKRDLLKKVVELSEIKRKEEADSQLKTLEIGDNSVLRSILKKRASLRRSSSFKKPKAKKVLFDGFKNTSDEEKENETSQNDFNAALDEPTVFLNFQNHPEDSSFDTISSVNCIEPITTSKTEINDIIKLWALYKDNLNSLQSERNTLENSLESLLQHSLDFQKEYKNYRQTSGDMITKLSKLGEEIEEKLHQLTTEATPSSKKQRKSLGKGEKIKMSDRSKVIKKNSGRKSVPFIQKDILNDMEDSFKLISKSSCVDY